MGYGDYRNDRTWTMEPLFVGPEHGLGALTQVEDGKTYLITVSRLPLRLGVTSIPEDLARELSIEDDQPVMHLSFGTSIMIWESRNPVPSTPEGRRRALRVTSDQDRSKEISR